MIYQMRRWLSPFCPYRSKDPFAERRANITAVIFLVLLMIIPVGVLVRFFVKGNFYPPDFIILAATFLAFKHTHTLLFSRRSLSNFCHVFCDVLRRRASY